MLSAVRAALAQIARRIQDTAGDLHLDLCLSNRRLSKEGLENVGSANLEVLLQSSRSLWIYPSPAMRCLLLSQHRSNETFAYQPAKAE